MIVILSESRLTNIIIFGYHLRQRVIPMLRAGPCWQLVSGPARGVHQTIVFVSFPICAVVIWLINVGQGHVRSWMILLFIIVVVQSDIIVMRLKWGLTALVDFSNLFDLCLDLADIFLLSFIPISLVEEVADAASKEADTQEYTDYNG